MRKPSLLHEVQQSNEAEINELQYMLSMRHSLVRHEILIVTIPSF